MTVTRTFLELTDPGALRAAPPVPEARIDLVDPPDGALNRRLYAEIGAPHAWTDLLDRDAVWWQAHAEASETLLATVDGEPAGYAELGRPGPEGVCLQYFGLRPPFQGRGLGGHLLTVALRRALTRAPRVWVETGTLDGPHALRNYEARGMRPYRRVTR